MGVRGRGRGASDEAGVARRGVQPREPPDVGPRSPRRAAPRPSRWSRTAPPRTPSGRRARRRRWPPRPDRGRRSTGTPTAGWPARVCTQSTWSRHAGPFHRSHRRAASSAKYAACRSRAASRSAASASRSSANVRIVSNRLYRVRAEPWWATTRDLRTSESRSRSTSTSSLVSGDGAQRRQVEAAGEHRRRAQRRALVVVQQVVGPGHRVPQGRLAIRSELGPGQQPEPVAEPVAHLDRAHRRHPRRGQLDAEGQPVERLADLDHRVARSARRRSRTRAGRRGPAPRTGSPRRRSRRRPRVSGATGHERLAGEPQVLSRRRQDPGDVGAGEDLARSPPRPPRGRARSCRPR